MQRKENEDASTHLFVSLKALGEVKALATSLGYDGWIATAASISGAPFFPRAPVSCVSVLDFSVMQG